MTDKEKCLNCGKEMVEGDYGPFVDYFCENCFGQNFKRPY